MPSLKFNRRISKADRQYTEKLYSKIKRSQYDYELQGQLMSQEPAATAIPAVLRLWVNNLIHIYLPKDESTHPRLYTDLPPKKQ